MLPLVGDQVRLVVGVAELLISRKGRFSQFETLVSDCENKTGVKEITMDDLQGFWDMVSVQVT